MTQPEPQKASDLLLDGNDFIRLIRSCAWSFLSRTQGFPPALPEAGRCCPLPMAALKIQNLEKFHKLLQEFFALDRLQPPESDEEIGSYAERLLAAWAEGDGEIIFHTSGSTGRPKASRHSLEMLRQEAEVVSALFGPLRRVAAAVPLLHSYGFVFGLLLPKLRKIEALDLPPLPTLLMNNVESGDLAVGFPLLFERLEGSPPAGVNFLSATAPCPDHLFEKFKSSAALSEIYGASETGAVAFRSAPGYFKLLSCWRKKDTVNLWRDLPRSQPQVHLLPDHVQWQGPDSFRPIGRRDQAIQVAGVNVYPGRVAALIKNHPLVRDCLVRPMRPEEGERLKAFVTAETGADVENIRLDLAAVFKELSPPERPASLRFGPELPIGPAGKPADWDI